MTEKKTQFSSFNPIIKVNFMLFFFFFIYNTIFPDFNYRMFYPPNKMSESSEDFRIFRFYI